MRVPSDNLKANYFRMKNSQKKTFFSAENALPFFSNLLLPEKQLFFRFCHLIQKPRK